MNDSRTTAETIAAVLLQWEEEWEQGKDIPAETLCIKCPQLIEVVRDRIIALKHMAWMTKSANENEGKPTEPDLLLGRTLAGRYQIETLIGVGGQGRVYRAFDQELQRHVALKVPKANRVTLPGQSDQFLEEARRAAKLRHPGIVSIHDVGRDDGLVFIVADLIEGQNLAELIERRRPSLNEASQIIASVADALQFAHDQGFVHRDIKPANILIDRHGQPHITDFGIAATFEQISKGKNSTSGTLAYMAPEQISGETHLIGTRTDIHAIGVVLYELVTGKLPFNAKTPHELRDDIQFRQPQPISSENGNVPEVLQRICLRCLSKHPSDRFHSMADLATALRESYLGSKLLSRILWGLIPVIAAIVGLTIWYGKIRNDSSPHSNESAVVPVVVLEPEEGVLFFDGKSRIVTPLISFVPCTLEAWIRTNGDRSEQFVIGSDVPHNFGIGIGVNNRNPIAESIRGGFHVDMQITPGKWTHLAAVYSPNATLLFVDGKEIGVGPATQQPSIPTHFVIGNVGEDHTNLFFNGQIRCLRISTGERYSGDFEPESSFSPDAPDSVHQAVLIFEGSKVDGDRLIDLSGNGNHGKWTEVSI